MKRGSNLWLVQYKIKIDDKTFRSISFLQTVKVSEFNELLEIFKEFWNVQGIEYNYDYPQIDSIIFTYRILSLLKYKMIKSTFYRSPNEHLEKKLMVLIYLIQWISPHGEIMKYQMTINMP